MDDILPQLVDNFVRRNLDGASLLTEVHRHVAVATRPYPDAYFTLGRKNPESVEDLAHRVFTVCARVPKGRFPFLSRPPFRAYVEEHMDGRSIRYHSFYAQISITREIMRDDYASNVVRDPLLRARAERFEQVGAALKAVAETVGPGRPPKWRLPGQNLGLVRSNATVVADLVASGLRELPELVARALRSTGPITQARLAALLEQALPIPVEQAELESAPPPADTDLRLGVREAVLAAWNSLERPDQELLLALARGQTYDEIIAAFPRYQHRVALTRAVTRCNGVFLREVASRMGGEAQSDALPGQLAEAILEVLFAVVPELEGRAA